MTATGNEAVSLKQLKDYADNQSSGGGSGYTYKNDGLSTTSSTFGNWVLKAIVPGTTYASPFIAFCYNDSELLLESVSPMMSGRKWALSVTTKVGNVHCLGVSQSYSEKYPMYIAAPYVSYANYSVNGLGVLLVNKTENTLTVENTTRVTDEAIIMATHLRFYVTED